MSKDQRTFVTKITDNIAKMEGSMRSLSLIEVDDPDKMVELNLEKAKSDLHTGIEKQKAYIRYPV